MTPQLQVETVATLWRIVSVCNVIETLTVTAIAALSLLVIVDLCRKRK